MSKTPELRHICLAFFVLMLLVCFPLFLVKIPPIADLPNHLARIHILRHIATNSTLAQYYVESWGFIPNLTIDIFGVFIFRKLPIYLFSKITIILLFFVLSAGTVLLHFAVHKKISYWPFVCFLLLYNRMFLWGVINYLFGVGCFLCALAAWIYFRNQSPGKRIAIITPLVLFTYFSHLFPFGLLVLAIFGYELQIFFQKRKFDAIISLFLKDVAIIAAIFLLPVIFFVFLSPTAEYSGHIAFGDFTRKLLNAPMMTFNNYNLALDLATFLLVIGGLVVGILTGVIHISPTMFGVLAVMSFTHFVMPQYLMSSPGADIRTILPLTFTILASISWISGNRLLKVIVSVSLGVLLLTRTSYLAYNWRWADRAVLSEYYQAFSYLEEGAKLDNLFLNPYKRFFTNPPHSEYVTLAIIEKSAFVPRLFAHPAQQPIEFASRYKRIAKAFPVLDLHRPDPNNPLIPDEFDKDNPFYLPRLNLYEYFLIANVKSLGGELPPVLQPVFQGEYISLYKIKAEETD